MDEATQELEEDGGFLIYLHVCETRTKVLSGLTAHRHCTFLIDRHLD